MKTFKKESALYLIDIHKPLTICFKIVSNFNEKHENKITKSKVEDRQPLLVATYESKGFIFNIRVLCLIVKARYMN